VWEGGRGKGAANGKMKKKGGGAITTFPWKGRGEAERDLRVQGREMGGWSVLFVRKGREKGVYSSLMKKRRGGKLTSGERGGGLSMNGFRGEGGLFYSKEGKELRILPRGRGKKRGGSGVFRPTDDP